MISVRTPAVAGLFYPADPWALGTEVDQLLAAADTRAEHRPLALVVPHAGYIYSGAIAASGYHCLLPWASSYRRVILLGPSHRHAFTGLALPVESRFATPLGEIELDSGLSEQALGFAQVRQIPQAHISEHSLEVQLPFLQRILPEFTLLPLVVGDASFAEVAQVISACWQREDTLLLVSSDLSHYLDYDQACIIDARTSAAIVARDPDAIPDHGACGIRPLGGLLQLARQQGLEVCQLDVRNSGDTAGSRDRVVGYGCYVLYDRVNECS